MSVSEAAVPGEEVGRVKAKDPDIGENGLVTYNIVDGDGMDLFEITTDYETQEGVVKLKKVSWGKKQVCEQAGQPCQGNTEGDAEWKAKK